MKEEFRYMFARKVMIIFILVMSLLAASTVAADDGRINMPPYHFGGDTLYCNNVEGCTVLNIQGLVLWNWPQIDIADAMSAADLSQSNQLVGQGQGTYGPNALWIIWNGNVEGNKSLCFTGIDEWNKDNDLCFEAQEDGKYLPAPLPIADPAIVVQSGKSVADCSMWSINDWVRVIANHSIFGDITAINSGAGTVTIQFGVNTWNAGCDEIELGPT